MLNLWIFDPFAVIYTYEPYILYTIPYKPNPVFLKTQIQGRIQSEKCSRTPDPCPSLVNGRNFCVKSAESFCQTNAKKLSENSIFRYREIAKKRNYIFWLWRQRIFVDGVLNLILSTIATLHWLQYVYTFSHLSFRIFVCSNYNEVLIISVKLCNQ